MILKKLYEKQFRSIASGQNVVNSGTKYGDGWHAFKPAALFRMRFECNNSANICVVDKIMYARSEVTIVIVCKLDRVTLFKVEQRYSIVIYFKNSQKLSSFHVNKSLKS